jgi:NAD(P)-dependent dehydrogenase (short-subunit alcohol dehydrogenase family)
VQQRGFGTSGAFARLDLARETELVRVNVDALHELTGALLPGMVERGAGAILNVPSIAGIQPLPRDLAAASRRRSLRRRPVSHGPSSIAYRSPRSPRRLREGETAIQRSKNSTASVSRTGGSGVRG